MSVRTDAARIFLTAWLVYAAFWNPWLQSSMTFNCLDLAVSFVDTGHWGMAHPQLYEGKDTAMANGRLVSAEPPGTAVLIMPLYLGWRFLVGPVDTPETFQAFNGALALTVGATASALVAVQSAWLAGWLGAGRYGRLLTSLLVAFGTQNFFFGTTLFKENLSALAVLMAVRLAVGPGGDWRRIVSGAMCSVATAVTYPAGLLIPLLLFLVGKREGVKQVGAFLVGCAPFVFALGAYHTWLFGKPWLTGYYFVTGLSNLGFVPPKIAVLFDLLVGPRGGLFLYAPFLLLAVAGVAAASQTEKRGEATVAVVFLVGLWIVAASWQSQFYHRGGWAHSLGPRMMFPAIPLLAAFAGMHLERAARSPLFLVGVPSILCGYLSAQAGTIPEGDPFPYAIKTWLSGTGMGVFFKEALPAWLGLETLHSMVSRPEVTASDLLRLMGTDEGWVLVRNQLAMLGLNLAVLCGIVWLLRKLWRQTAS